MRRLLSWLIVLAALYAVINFRWTHAAFVYYVASETCDEQALRVAKERVADLFGGVSSTPKIGCLWQPSFGLGRTIGTTNFALGFDALILLNADGNDVDVIAHEWAHAELAERVGFLDRNFVLPTWVDEGVAMQVDYRPAYGGQALEQLHQRDDLQRPAHAHLDNPSGFFHAGDQGRYHYAWAKCAMASWLEVDADWQQLARTDWSRHDQVCQAQR